jgi:hypothetical protein
MGGRAYVPGFASDLFLSYAREDSAWVGEFQEKLAGLLVNDSGLEAEIWRDISDIRFGQNWKEQMLEAIKQAALFLAVLSPNYQNSDYCNEESDYFQALREEGSDLRIGEVKLYRYLKVIKMPSEDGWHLQVLKDLQHIEFFDYDPKRKLNLPTTEFDLRVRLVANAIAATLNAMRRMREKVFVASPADDVYAEWKEMRDELQGQGYVVTPSARLNRGVAPEFIRETFEGSVLSIHLLGSEHHPLAETQLDLVAQSGQRMAVWIRKGADEQANQRQKELLKGVRDFSRIPKGSPVMEGGSSRTNITNLLELLKPASSRASVGSNGKQAPSVYLICDPSEEADRNFALDLERQIETREKMTVLLPRNDISGAADRHRQMLAECDGVLLYREKAPEPWFYQYLTDVNRAERLVKRDPLKSKAVLAGADYLEDLPARPDVRLLARTEPFTLETLEPFLAPLRKSGGEAAYAGD